MGFGAGYGGGSFGDFCGVELVEVEGGEEIESGVRKKAKKDATRKGWRYKNKTPAGNSSGGRFNFC